MSEPSEEDINNVCEMLEASDARDRQMFARALKANHYSISQVVGEYFESRATFRAKYSWDEGQFAADRDGSSIPTFQVQGPDQFMSNSKAWDQASGLPAPSRPPSRTQNRSPLGAPTTVQQESDDLNRAILESARNAVSGGGTPQESGITNNDPNLPFFGPANRETYDSDQWAMVRLNQETVNSSPPARKRDPLQPVLLACGLQSPERQRQRLGLLLMIKHQIPAARNFFLSLNTLEPPPSYNRSPTCWNDDAVPASCKEEAEEAEQYPEASTNDHENGTLVQKLQRLMAFLDTTTGGPNGTAETLCEIPAMDTVWGEDLVHFYQALYHKVGSQTTTSTMWTVVRLESSIESSPTPSLKTTSEFGILELTVPDELSDVLHNLYSLWDAIFWINQDTFLTGFPSEESERIAYLEKPAEVLTMRIKFEQHPISIPETFFVDRYLEKNLGTARDMKSKIFQIWTALARSKDVQAKVTKWQDPNNPWKEYDRILMTQKVIKEAENQIWRIRANALWREYEESAGTRDEIPYLPNELNESAKLNEEERHCVEHLETAVALAKRRLAQIDRQLARLREEKAACVAFLERMSKVLTVPTEKSDLNPTHKYTLRGVITSPEVVYLCRRRDAEPFERENATEKVDEWWRVSWTANNQNLVKQERTTIKKIQTAMFVELDTDGSSAPILVYATDKALNEELKPLSSVLQKMVKADNRRFQQKLMEEPIPSQTKRNAPHSPKSPPKRQRSDSMDSMATNRASFGDSSDDVEERAAMVGKELGEMVDLLADQFGDELVDFGDGSDSLVTLNRDERPARPQELTVAKGAPPSPPISAKDEDSEHDAPGIRRSSEWLAQVSLDNQEQTGHAAGPPRGPEMQERVSPVTPFIVRRPNGTVDRRASIMDQAMEIEGSMEIPAVEGNPEDYYK